MTKPTLSLSSAEYRALVLANLAQAHDFVSNNPLIGDHLKSFCEHMDRVKVLASAWHFAAPQHPAAEKIDPPKVEAQTNGHAEPKPKKGGWPKGKSRKQSQQAVQ